MTEQVTTAPKILFSSRLQDGTLSSLATRAKLVADTLNTIEGFRCNVVQGAMYAFPQIHLPEKVSMSKRKFDITKLKYRFAVVKIY